MANLYSIRFIHYAGDSEEEGIYGYVVAENDEEVYEFIKSEPTFDRKIFNSYEDYESGEIEPYWDDSKETFKQRMIRQNGQIDDLLVEVDTMNGETFVGWRKERIIEDEGDISILMYYLGLKVL